MTDRQQHEWIERYLLGELSGEEQQAFEKRLLEDSVFAREVAFQRMLLEAVQNKEALDFRAKLDKIQKENRNDRTGRIRFLSRPVMLAAIAASLAVLAIAGYFLIQREASPELPADLFTYAEEKGWPVYPATLFSEISERGGSLGPDADSTAAAISIVNSAYQSGDYQQALNALQALSIDSIGSDRYFFYAGLLQMRIGRPVEAAASLAQVNSGNYYRPARWNRALSLIAADRRPEAVSILKELRDAGYKIKESEQLLRLLRTAR